MARLSITELKKDTIFQYGGKPYKVVDYAQKVMGRGGSIVSVKIKSLLDDKVLDKTFKGNDTVESADVATRSAQFLYSDKNNFYFMNTENYANYKIPYSVIGESNRFLTEGSNAKVQDFNGNIISVVLPKNVDLKVEYAEDAVKGDTAMQVEKDAKLETGLNVKVPAFIKTGDIISVDTTTGKYRERKQK